MRPHRLSWALRYLWRFYLDWVAWVVIFVCAGYGIAALAVHVMGPQR